MNILPALKRISTILVYSCFMLISSHPGIAGQIDQFLEEKLYSTAAMEKLQVIIFMKDQVDLQQMEIMLRAAVPPGRRIPVNTRYRTILTALQGLAGQTQSVFRQHLSRYVADGMLTIESSFWIRNIVVVNSTPNVIREIAAMPEVETVFYDEYLERDIPVRVSGGESHPAASEPGLRAIHADKLWELGYTGVGRIVMNIDTGVEGDNLSFNTRWRGNSPGIHAGWAWFDPETNTTFPTDGDGVTQHGTHTMGIMCGVYESTNDTLGVAPGARWIAAKTLNLSPHTSRTIAAFQWAANPDSNINTMDDLPDAINCSWYDPNVSGTECSGASGYYATIDAVEALGIAVIFSAGNFGPGPSTITPPKNRITTGVNFFSVGAVNANTSGYPIASFSSRGPSVCAGPDSLRIKPEVSAPGVGVRSAAGINGFRTLDGTSMASPHVAGSIALLRQIAPFLTGTEIKNILMNTASDLGTSGDDNNYGHGLIDLWNAYLNLPLNVGFIKGEVASGGNPLSGVKMDFVDSLQHLSSTSDINGNYTLSARIDTSLMSARFILRAQKFGYLTYSDTVTIVLDDTVTRNISLVPAPGGTLQVHAYNSSTNMRVGIKVMFGSTTIVDDSTDAVAGFLSVSLPQGNYDVIINPSPPYGNRIYSNITITPDTTTSIEALLRHMIEFSPATLNDTLVEGQTDTRTLTLTNTTGDSILFRISDDEALFRMPGRRKAKPLSQQQYVARQLPKDVEDTNPGYTSRNGRGGPDPFGYEWIDSDEPDGPAFNWIDITGIGTGIPTSAWTGSTGTSNADDGQVHIVIPFSFSFYGGTYDSLKLCTNGWAGFDISSTNTEYSNSLIPSAREPNTSVYPWWDDLDLRTSGTVHYYDDAANSRFIIQYTNVPHYTGTSGTYTFQIILNASGSILLQYLSMQQTVNSATIGSENPDGSIGLMIAHNAAYMHDSLAILLNVPDADWASENPSNGILPPQSSQDIAVMFNASGLNAGTTYNANIFVYGTHPDIANPDLISIVVPVTLAVTSVSGIGNREEIPKTVMLSQNYPNPFNPTTTIDFGLPEKADVTLQVFDILGREICSLATGSRDAGFYRVEWNSISNRGTQVASGPYFYRLAVKGSSGTLFVSLKKLLFLK